MSMSDFFVGTMDSPFIERETFTEIKPKPLSAKQAKESFIKEQAEKWKSQIDPRAYNALINYTVNIDD